MIMCVLLCYPVSIRIYQQGVLFLVNIIFRKVLFTSSAMFASLPLPLGDN